MRLKKETDILNPDFRAVVIEEIEGAENVERKKEAKRRYDVFKDNTKKYVLEAFQDESENGNIVAEIKNRVTNVSFCRKVIDKKALVYKDGASREFNDNEEYTTQLESIYDIINFNSKMKKTNKYSELFKNALTQVYSYEDQVTGTWKYILKVLPPFLYDVIEDQDNPENARVVIFSYYSNEGVGDYKDVGQSGVRNARVNNQEGDGVNQTIADSPADAAMPQKHYVWWSSNYHFTTDDKGLVISGMQEDDLSNPIGMLPFVDFSMDKDGHYWAEGGDDIVDASILINVLLTDLYYIMKYQGMGIFYLIGKGVPSNIRIGPSTGIIMKKEEGDPDAQIGFASSNPPINDHIAAIQQYLMFVLSTNNLGSEEMGAGINGGNAQSALQEIVRRAENMDDIEDQKEMYRDNEKHLYTIIAKWHNFLLDRNLLDQTYAKVGKLPELENYSIKFAPPQPFMTEKEKLEIIEKRLTLELDGKVDAVMKDNPSLSREEAEEKVRRTQEELLAANSAKMRNAVTEAIENENDVESNI